MDSVKLNLLDTPGYGEFVGQVVPCLWVAENALVVVDGVSGVEVHTRRMYTMARDMGLSAVAIVTKLEKERADFAAVAASMKDSLPGAEFVPVQLPLGKEAALQGVVDLVDMKAYLGDSKTPVDIPGEFADAAEEARMALIDAVAATDDDLTMAYLENDTLSDAELKQGLTAAIRQGKLVPVLACAVEKNVGVGAALRALADFGQSPATRAPWAGTDAKSGAEITVKSDDPFAAVVFKTMSDPYVGRISLLRGGIRGGAGRRDRNQRQQRRAGAGWRASRRCRGQENLPGGGRWRPAIWAA